jgi:hypothetical protein
MVLAVVERGPPTGALEVTPVRGLQHSTVPTGTLYGTQDATTHVHQCERTSLWIVTPDNV